MHLQNGFLKEKENTDGHFELTENSDPHSYSDEPDEPSIDNGDEKYYEEQNIGNFGCQNSPFVSNFICLFFPDYNYSIMKIGSDLILSSN